MTDLDFLMQGADPASPLDEKEAAVASLALAREITASDPSAVSVRRRHRRWAAGLAVLAIAVPTTAYAADRFLAQTGEHLAASTENDTSEVINVCAADFPTYVLSLPQPTDPAPAGMTWTDVGHIVAERYSSGPDCAPGGVGALAFETGIRNSYYRYAESVYLCRAVRDHDAGRSESGLANARLFATMMDRSEELGTFGDENWKPYRDAGRTGNWPLLKQFAAANAAEPCP
jgi:hypothetical protein